MSDSDAWRAPPLPERLDEAPAGRRVLCFAPHPDDEVIGPGATLALHCARGDAVRVVCATDGAAGDPDGGHDRQTLAERRRAESTAACRELGTEDLVFWGLPDNHEVTADDLEMVAGHAARELASFAPDLVYLPWDGEWHADHRALHHGARRGLDRAGFAGGVLGYEVWSPIPIPDLVIGVGEAAVTTKRRALSCHASQLAYLDYAHPTFGLMAYRSMIRHGARGHCEAFRRYR